MNEISREETIREITKIFKENRSKTDDLFNLRLFLRDRSYSAIYQYFYEDKTYSDIGKTIERLDRSKPWIGGERVRTIINRALRRLRHPERTVVVFENERLNKAIFDP